jgi:Mn-dependent DtxR family transcriptional regulator
MKEPVTAAVQNYLKAIHTLGGVDRTVSPVDIAERLKVRAPSVTGMLRRMADAGLIRYEVGKGAQLTEAGVAQARRVIRRHRLVELFLARVLGLDWSEVDAEAEALEHAISPRLEQAIAAHLGEPLEDTHGHPIPTARRPARCHPRGTGRQPRPAAALAKPRPDPRRHGRVRQPSAAGRHLPPARRGARDPRRQRGPSRPARPARPGWIRGVKWSHTPCGCWCPLGAPKGRPPIARGSAPGYWRPPLRGSRQTPATRR